MILWEPCSRALNLPGGFARADSAQKALLSGPLRALR